MVFEQFIRYAGLAVGVMVFEQFIRYAGLAVGLKPSATGCEARRRGLERMMYSKTINPRLPLRSPPAWPVEPAKAGFSHRLARSFSRRADDVDVALAGSTEA